MQFQYQGPLSFADVSIFMQKISAFWPKQCLYSKEQCESYVKNFLVLFCVFVGLKVTVNENISFTDYASGIRLPDCSKLAVNLKNGNDVTIFWNNVIVNFFRFLTIFINFSYWSKFDVNIITGSGVMTISIYKGLTRNPEIGSTSFEFAQYLETRASKEYQILHERF